MLSTLKGRKQRRLGIGVLMLLGVAIAVARWQPAQASYSWMGRAESQYPTIVGTPLDDCTLCHTSVPSTNPYGRDYKNNNESFTAIQNLDSDGDGYSNLVEINAHTFPGDANSHPVTPPTPTWTPVPPTATATNTRVPPTATATQTRVPPTATATNTRVPATATATATATHTRIPPTATTVNTPPAPGATATRAAPTVTSTRLAPTLTRTRTTAPGIRTPTRPPTAKGQIAFRDVIRQLPSTKNLVGDWQVGNKTVHVTSQTKISRDDDDDAIRVGTLAKVRGTQLANGTVNATSITVLEQDEREWFREWLKGVARRLGLIKEDEEDD